MSYKKPHIPPRLPVPLDYRVFARELAQAEYALGLLEGSQKKLPNPKLLIAPLTAKEAAVSSKIEGTQSTASDVFVFEASGQQRRPDTQEVVNYRRAMLFAIEYLAQQKPFSIHLIKRLHHILLLGVRHKGTTGEFRNKRVWIAERPGDPIEQATYIPPEHILVRELMDNVVEYIENGENENLLKAGIMHYQFEAVHPFEDGNGRIGRLLIPLLLYHKRKLTLPIIYLSGFFEEKRDEYIAALHAVDEKAAYEEWLAFFLRAITYQANETQALIKKIYQLNDGLRTALQGLKSPYIIPFIETIFQHPVFTIPMLVHKTQATRLTCGHLLKTFIAHGHVRELVRRRGRLKLFAFDRLLQIIR